MVGGHVEALMSPWSSRQPDVPLPMTRAEMREWWGWDGLDVLLVTGDAYVDHPAFGAAVIGRVLVDAGFRVGVVAQPQSDADWLALARPRLFVGVTAGNLDSMLNRYTAARKRRSEDHYGPGGRAGLRPDRATIPYVGAARRLFPGVPVVIGGIEASLRRLAHYDHWSESVRRSLLADSKADLLVYGMGERQVREIARRLGDGEGISALTDLRGTCFMAAAVPADDPWGRGTVTLPAYAVVKADPRRFAEADQQRALEQDAARGKRLVQEQNPGRVLVQNPPAAPLDEAELDAVYALPYTRREHPRYRAEGVPALATVATSITTHRGCVADCAFCSLSAHQGRDLQSRSVESVVREAEGIAARPGFAGTISDVGGPSANMYRSRCDKMRQSGACTHRDCLLPEPCPNFISGCDENLVALRRIRAVPGVKHAFVQSGVRHDLALRDGDRYLRELLAHHVSGQLKVAPEAADDRVLSLMGKPPYEVYRCFRARVRDLNRDLGKRQFLVEYLIAAHPGCDLATMVESALRLRRDGLQPDQVQEFIPLPMTRATAMFVSGLDPRTMAPVSVVRGERERRMQKALLHSTKPENRALVLEALRRTGRMEQAPLLLGTAAPAPAKAGPPRRPARHSSRKGDR
jgi:uncharacterized radical SAM protein YgiQ